MSLCHSYNDNYFFESQKFLLNLSFSPFFFWGCLEHLSGKKDEYKKASYAAWHLVPEERFPSEEIERMLL